MDNAQEKRTKHMAENNTRILFLLLTRSCLTHSSGYFLPSVYSTLRVVTICDIRLYSAYHQEGGWGARIRT